MSNISATRGRQDMHRLCVCGSPRGDLSHIAGLTIGRSRSDFSGDNWRAQEPYMWGVGLTQDEGKCARVGREDEGVSSNRPELGAVVLALQSVGLNEDALLLCDNEAVLCVIRKWVGQGGKATLATAPDADILREIICLLTQRVRAGRATFPDKSEVASWRAD